MQIIHSNQRAYGSYEQDYLNWYKRKMKNAGWNPCAENCELPTDNAN